MEKYESEINRLNEDKEFTEYISEEEDARKVKNTLIYNAKKIKSIEIAKKMLKKNISIEDISEMTGLSKEEIEKL